MNAENLYFIYEHYGKDMTTDQIAVKLTVTRAHVHELARYLRKIGVNVPKKMSAHKAAELELRERHPEIFKAGE